MDTNSERGGAIHIINVPEKYKGVIQNVKCFDSNNKPNYVAGDIVDMNISIVIKDMKITTGITTIIHGRRFLFGSNQVEYYAEIEEKSLKELIDRIEDYSLHGVNF